MNATIFTQHSSTPLYVAPAQANSAFIAYYLLETLDASGTLTLKESWEERVGYYLFLKRPPDKLDAFAALVSALFEEKFKKQSRPQHTSFLWLRHSESLLSEIATIESKPDEADPSKIVLVQEVLLDFGGYKIPFANAAPVVYENPEDPSGFVFLLPANPPNRCPSIATVPESSDGVHLTFKGERRGCFECLAFIGDYYSRHSSSWHVGLRYAVNVNDRIIHQFYPVFDLRDGRRPLLKMCWDLTDHLDPDRTFLEFQAESVKPVPTRKGHCNFDLETPKHREIVPTYFRTVIGKVIGLIPKKGSAKLVFELWTEHPDPRVLDDLESSGDWRGEIESPANARYYLVPRGQFELVLIEVDEEKHHAFEPITSPPGERPKIQIPSHFLCGLSGIESVEFTPQNEDPDGVKVPGHTIEFFPRKPAYVPTFPIIRPITSTVATLNDLELIQRKYLTAWIGFAGVDDGFAYLSQPEEAPLYTTKRSDSKDEQTPSNLSIPALFEPVAASLPLASIERSFPVAPAAGAVPASRAPDRFLKSLENQIIGPYRREEIRKRSDSPATNAPAATLVTAVTPQGLKAMIGPRNNVRPQKWTELLLAQRKAKKDENGSAFELSFSTLEPELQAAFQSNQLFLVVSNGTPIKAFKSVVRMGSWEFDLSPAKSDPDNLKNILIFKFSPGKLVERIRDPRSWTNPEDFNTSDKAKLSKLAAELTAFFDSELTQKLNDPATVRYYEGLQTIIEDESWTGIVGVNILVKAGALPSGLRMIAAGVNKLVAHHIVVETSTLELTSRSFEPAECSLFGLIDGVGAKASAVDKPDVDFAVTRLLAHFLKGELADFSCKAELTLNKLFGERVKPDPPSATAKTIHLSGARERHAGRDTYSLVIDPADLEKPVTLDSSVIEEVRFDKAEFSVAEKVVETDTQFSATLAFAGTVGFHALNSGACDLFSYKKLPYSGLMVRMEFLESKPKERDCRFDLTGLSFNATPVVVDIPPKPPLLPNSAPSGIAILRENSLVRRFPMKLQKFYESQSGTDPKKDGYVPVKTDLEATDLGKALYAGKPFFGLDFTLNLGTLGEFASNAGITVGLLLAWSPKPSAQKDSTNRINVFLKFPGISGAATDIGSLQGVVKLGASTYELKAPGENRPNWALMLNGIALRILGIGFPLDEKLRPNLHIFGPPSKQARQEPETSLGWYAVYPSKAKP